MCLTLYIGSNLALPQDRLIDGAEPRIVCVEADRIPAALAGKSHVSMIVEAANGQTYCSCAFQEESLPWKQVEEGPQTIAAFDCLRTTVESLCNQGDTPLVFACWTDCEPDPPALVWRLSPESIRPGFGLFQAGELMPDGMPPETFLLEFDPSLSEPQHRVPHVS
jgi:hypothetical protein